MSYQDEMTGRLWSLFLEEGSEESTLAEFLPSGGYVAGWTDIPNTEPIIKPIPGWIEICQMSPNKMVPQAMLRSGVGFEDLLTAPYYRHPVLIPFTVETAAHEIARAIREDRHVRNSRPRHPQERLLNSLVEANRAVEWNEALIRALQRQRKDFDACYRGRLAISGLRGEWEERVNGYLEAPSWEKWVTIRSHRVTPMKTLWQCWLLTDDETASRRAEDARHPSRASLLDGLDRAIDEDLRQATSRLDDAQERLEALKAETSNDDLLMRRFERECQLASTA